MLSPELYLAYTVDRGWSPQRWEYHLTRLVSLALLPPRAMSRRRITTPPSDRPT